MDRKPEMSFMLSPGSNQNVIRAHGIMGMLIIALVLLFLPCVVQAQVTSLTHLSTYDADEIIVSYYEYLALDCPDEAACAYTKAINTPGRAQHNRVAAVIAGFNLWTPKPDKIGRIAVRVSGHRGATPGTVDLRVSGNFQSSRKQLFSYRVQIAVIESSIEGLDLTETGAACGRGKCPSPVTMIAPGAVPPGHRFLGFGLQMFDSDRRISPFWGATAIPITKSINPVTGDVNADLICGTSETSGLPIPRLSGPCETRWVAIAALPNNIAGGPVNGLPLTPIAPQTIRGASGINSANPSTATPSLVCPPHPNPSKGYIDVLAGFFLLAGQFTGNAFTPATGNGDGIEVGVNTLGFSPSGAPLLTYNMGLPVMQRVLPPLPPTVAPLSHLRLTTSACLYH